MRKQNNNANALKSDDLAYNIRIIDEIGPMELFSPKIKETLNTVINSEAIVVGTIFLHSHPEVDRIKENQHIELYEITEENRDLIPNEIAAKVKEQIEL